MPTQIRITDPAVIRKVVEEQRRQGDRTATRTAGKIIENYFAINDALSKKAMAATSD